MSMSKQEEQPRPLEYASTVELWLELSSRFENAVLTASRPMKGDDGASQHLVWWSNGWAPALGLATLAKAYILSSGTSESGPDPDDT